MALITVEIKAEDDKLTVRIPVNGPMNLGDPEFRKNIGAYVANALRAQWRSDQMELPPDQRAPEFKEN